MGRLRGSFILLGVLAACSSDSGPVPVTLANMAGSWDATAVRYVDFADATNSLDLLAAAGVSIGAEIRDDGRLILLPSGQPPGTTFVTLAADVMTLGFQQFTVMLNSSTMRWVGLDTFAFDFDPGDGVVNDVFQQWDWRRN